MRRHVLPTAPSPTTTHLKANCHVSEQENADSAEDGGCRKRKRAIAASLTAPPPCQRVGDDDILGINKAPCDAAIVPSLKGEDQKKKKKLRRGGDRRAVELMQRGNGKQDGRGACRFVLDGCDHHGGAANAVP